MAEDLSVILPCYNSALLAVRSAELIRKSLRGTGLTWEVLIINDGGTFDATDMLQEFNGQVRLISLQRNAGKGAAVREGIKHASGHVVAFTDVDLPYGCEHFEPIVRLIADSGFHLVIGDRSLSRSSYLMEQSPQRRAASGIFTAIVGRFITGGFFDTQCGLKAIRRDVAVEICRASTVNRFAFDVELLLICLTNKLDIKRIPVRLQNNQTSSVRLFSDSINMLFDLARIKLNALTDRYRSDYLADLVSREYQSRLHQGRETGHIPLAQVALSR